MAFTKITGPGIHTLSNIMTHNVKSSGIITAVNGNLTGWLAVGSTASFGGDVSIGGTLTYDDVTNVEAVGIITAKAGIHVGAAGTIIHALSEDNGKVGIGTDNPSHKLDISGDGVAFPSASGSTLLRLRDSAGTATLSIDAAAGSFSAIQFGDSAAASMGSILYNHVDDSMKFNTGGTGTKLFIASDGKVGIGTDNPGHQLDGASDLVIGNQGEADSGMTFVSTTNGQSLIHFSDALSGNARYDGFIGYEHTGRFLKFGTAQDLRMVIRGTSGRVGINSIDPRGNLDVIESVGTAATIFVNSDTHNTNVASISMLKLGYKHSSGQAIGYLRLIEGGGNSFDGSLRFGVPYNVGGGNFGTRDDVVTINHNGRVGIGSTIPTNTLVVREQTDNNSSLQLFRESTGGDIASMIWATNSGNQAQINYRGGGGSTGMQFYTGGTGSSNLRAIIDTSGKVGIGTNAPNMTLHVKSTSDDVARFQSTNAGSGTAITLDHIGGSPADNDIAGKIVFNGQDDGYNSLTYADIRCITSDVSNGTETAHLDFSTRGLGSFAAVFRINRRSTASAPSYTTDDADGVILDVYNTGNPYPRYMNLIAKSAGDTDSNIGFWTESVGGSPSEKLRITSGGSVLIDTTVTTEAGGDFDDLIIGSTSDTSKGISIVGSTTGGVGSLTFTDGASYKNQGIIQYRHADDSMRFHTNQYERLRITSAGICSITTPGNTQEGAYYTTLTINNTGSNTWSRLRFDRSGVAKWGLSLGTDDKFRITNLYTDGSVANPDDDCVVISNTSKISIGEDDPEDNHVLIRGSSTVATKSGHIMLTGDSATIDEGPQIVFAESGATTSYAGGYVGFKRTGTNSIGQLVFGTRGESGNANTVPSERLRINSNGKFTLNNGASEYASGTIQNVDQNEWQVCDPVIQWSTYAAVGAILMVVYENNNADGNNQGAYFVGPATSAYGGFTTTPFTRFSGSDAIEAKIDQVGGTGNYKLHLRTTHSSADGNSHKFLRWTIIRAHSL